MSSRVKKAAILTCAVALILRLVYLWEAQANPMHLAPQMDARYHLEWAQALLSGSDHHPGPFFRAPLYPWFLAALLWCTQGSIKAVLALQALLGALTTWLTFSLARRALPRSGARGPLIAAALVAANWVLIYFDGELLLPTLAIPLQLHALLQTLRFREERTARSGLLTGASWGLAAIVRPNVLLFLAFMCAWETLRRPRKLQMALALAAGAVVPIAPLTAYNASQGDTVLISSQAGINLWIGNNPQSDGATAVVPGTRPDWWGGHQDAVRQAERAEGRHLMASEVSRHYTGRAIAWAKEDPQAFISHLLHKLRLLVSHRELGNNADVDYVAERFSWTMRALPPSYAILFGLGLTGILLGLRRRELRPELAAYLAIYAFSILAFFVCARFRAPLLPILAVGAGHWLAWTYSALKQRPREAWSASLLAGALIATSVFASPPGGDSSAPGEWQLGIAAMRSGDHKAAIQHFEASLQDRPDYWYSLRDLGAARLQIGDLAGAERALLRGLEVRPHEPWLADLLADVYFNSRRPAQLRELGETQAEALPEHANAYYHLARAALLEDDTLEAKEHVQRGLLLDPEGFTLLFLDARIRMSEGDTSGACEAISAARRAALASHNQEQSQLADIERARMGCP